MPVGLLGGFLRNSLKGLVLYFSLLTLFCFALLLQNHIDHRVNTRRQNPAILVPTIMLVIALEVDFVGLGSVKAIR